MQTMPEELPELFANNRSYADFSEAEWLQIFEKTNRDDPEGFVPLTDIEYWADQKANILEGFA
jgi:hypothetical protein